MDENTKFKEYNKVTIREYVQIQRQTGLNPKKENLPKRKWDNGVNSKLIFCK